MQQVQAAMRREMENDSDEEQRTALMYNELDKDMRMLHIDITFECLSNESALAGSNATSMTAMALSSVHKIKEL